MEILPVDAWFRPIAAAPNAAPGDLARMGRTLAGAAEREERVQGCFVETRRVDGYRQYRLTKANRPLTAPSDETIDLVLVALRTAATMYGRGRARTAQAALAALRRDGVW